MEAIGAQRGIYDLVRENSGWRACGKQTSPIECLGAARWSGLAIGILYSFLRAAGLHKPAARTIRRKRLSDKESLLRFLSKQIYDTFCRENRGAGTAGNQQEAFSPVREE